LGRVLVSIDDLTALLDVLAVESPPSSNYEIEFDGGSIDTPEDLRSLSDSELERLMVKTPDVEVVLSSDRAVAIGDSNMCSVVYKLWARGRQTRNTPQAKTRRDTSYSPIRSFALIMIAAIFAATVMAVVNYFVPPDATTGSNTKELYLSLHRDPIGSYLMLLEGAAMIGVIIAFIRLIYKLIVQPIVNIPKSYAVIKPLSHDELRKEVVITSRYRITITIAITSIVVATVTAILVKVFFT